MDAESRRNLRFRCTGCGKCCRETVVLVTHDDVQRVMDGTGMPAKEIVRFYGPDEFEMEKRHPFWIRFSTGRAVMGLKWKASGHCRYLGKDDLCTIYESRPITCREYPFGVELKANGDVDRVTITHVVDCPNEWDGNNTPSAIRALCGLNERQSDAYVAKVRAWNRLRKGPFTRPGFLRYLEIAA